MRMTLTNDDEETSHWSSSLHLQPFCWL